MWIVPGGLEEHGGQPGGGAAGGGASQARRRAAAAGRAYAAHCTIYRLVADRHIVGGENKEARVYKTSATVLLKTVVCRCASTGKSRQ